MVGTDTIQPIYTLSKETKGAMRMMSQGTQVGVSKQSSANSNRLSSIQPTSFAVVCFLAQNSDLGLLYGHARQKQWHKRYDSDSVWACVSHAATCHDNHQVGFAQRHLLFCLIMHLNESFNPHRSLENDKKLFLMTDLVLYHFELQSCFGRQDTKLRCCR